MKKADTVFAVMELHIWEKLTRSSKQVDKYNTLGYTFR